jgi:hypothetical protein
MIKAKGLRGDRNQCPSCGLLFNSTDAFQRHRTGSIGIDRRCRTEPEMLKKGMFLGDDGFWRGRRMREGRFQPSPQAQEPRNLKVEG